MKMDIRHLAKLARLKFDEAELQKFEQDMQKIVEMVEDLPEMDCSGSLLDKEQVMELREDRAENRYKRDELLANAPKTQAGCVVVPNVVE